MAKFYRSEDKTVLLEVFGAGSSIENLKSLKANTTDAAVEKHLPVVTQEGNKITVAVSSVEHPMLPEHYIMGVYIETKNGGQLHKFAPGDKPEAVFMLADGDELYDHPVHPYTKALLNSVPRLDRDGKEMLCTIEGNIPDMTNPPTSAAVWLN